MSGGRTAKSSSASAERWCRLMRVACSASLRVTPLETRACLSVSPKRLIVTIRLPSPRHTNGQGPSIPCLHRIGSRTFGQPKGRTGYCQASVGPSHQLTTFASVDPLSLLDDRGAASLSRETTHPRQRARHHRLVATSLQSPTGRVPGRPREPIGGA